MALARSLARVPALRAAIHESGDPAAWRKSRRAWTKSRTCGSGCSHRSRRAARQHRGRRRDPRRPPPGTRRAAGHQPEQPPVHRRDRSARAKPHRNSVAESALQQCLRLLHRDFEVQSPSGSNGLRAQADAGQRRALHHAGVEGTGGQDPRGGGEDPRTRKGDLWRAAPIRRRRGRTIRSTAAAIAELDATAALAQAAAENRYTRPRFSASGEMRIVPGATPSSRNSPRARPPASYERPFPEPRNGRDRRHHGPEHGRQVNLPPPGGADCDPGAGGLLRARRVGSPPCD